MRSVLTIIFIICMFHIGYGQEPANPGVLRIADPRKFDEWRDILFRDEKARLDNAALHWQQYPKNIIYLVIYAGQRACVDEARSRGIRAKKHLVKRHVPAEQIVWLDGGWQKEVTTEVWIWPPDMRKPSIFPEFNLQPSEVKLEKNCKIKRRRRANA
jgi:hypothetical protein